MSMLAEPRRKQKWNVDPRGKRWSEDANKFGQKMLEKMGWTSGKGLGINEQGITKHIMLDDKHDKAGIGYDRNSSDGWIEQQEKFNQFLQELPKYKNQERDYEKEWEKSEEDQYQRSLELKSKGSLARMHYKKFTRGKDISKYSSKDVMEIFGKKESTDKDQIEKKQDNCIHEEEAIGTKDNRGGVITINSGSMADYFKNKLPNHIKNLSSNATDNQMAQSDGETEQRVSFGLSLEAKSTLPSAYDVSKGFSKKIDYAFDNPYLELDNPTETVSKIDSSSSKKRKKAENATLHANETDKLNVGKKLKTEIINDTCRDGFTNLALNLDTKSNENCNGKEFEVSRAQFGLENCGFDLMDEENDKKRVTFNDHVEYSMDSIKKKKGKVTLDKYEVEDKRKKIKKKKRKNSTISMLNGVVNEALDVEILCPEAKKYEEIKDNKLNKLNELKRKSKKIKKTKICKISNLETIQESPEQEKEINDTKIVPKEITLDSDNAENETDTTKRKLKKKKKKEVNIEDVTVIDITDENRDVDVEQPIKGKKIKTDKSKTEELIITEKHKKKKKKDKKNCETDLVKNTIIAINRNQQDIEILEKSKKQNDHLVKVKNKDMSIKDPDIEILSVVITEKKEEKSLERVPKKEKGSHKKDNSKNDINVCEEKEISDKENADEMQDSNIGKLLKKDKKRKKSKKDDTPNIENTLNPSAQMVDTDIGGETAKLHINTFSETNEIDTAEVLIHSPWSEKARVSKKMLKTLFYKNLADFPGSNIREIKGYGVDDS